MDSPLKGRLGTIAFVLCMEVSLTWKVLLHVSVQLTGTSGVGVVLSIDRHCDVVPMRCPHW